MAHIKISFRRMCCEINHTCVDCDSTSRCPGLSLVDGDSTRCEHLYFEDVISEIPNAGFTYHSGDKDGKGGRFVTKGIFCTDLAMINYLEINGKVIVDRSEEVDDDTTR